MTLKNISFTAVLSIFFIFSLLPTGNAKDRIPVFVSILPQKFFVQQIGADLVDVQVMVQPGANPAIYEPKPSQMAKLSKTKLYFSIGVPFEHIWLPRIAAANPEMKIVDTDQGIEKQVIAGHDHHDHEKTETRLDHTQTPSDPHGGDRGLDPHIWLSPTLVIHQAGIILEALIRTAPDQQAFFENNHEVFTRKIRALDQSIRQRLKGLQGASFMVFHPSWGYFAKEYHLEQLAIEIEGKNPKPAQINRLIRIARERNIRIIFAQPQFSTKSAQLIAQQIKGRVVLADPLAEDWFANMAHIAEKFEEALK